MIFIKVEYENEINNITYEIFKSVNKAFKFAKSVNIKNISLVNMNNIFYEKDLKSWNYEDFSNTLIEEVV